MDLAAQIEALLFWRGEPMTTAELSTATNRPPAEIDSAITELNRRLTDRGVALIQTGEQLALGTRPEASDLIRRLVEAELSKELSRASLETLTIILYQGPISRAGIDYIRGVNSSFILRHLQIRGLIEKSENPKDKRGFLYQPSIELLSHLGVAKIEELPDYRELRAKLEQIKDHDS